jgi:hypothetical protein
MPTGPTLRPVMQVLPAGATHDVIAFALVGLLTGAAITLSFEVIACVLFILVASIPLVVHFTVRAGSLGWFGPHPSPGQTVQGHHHAVADQTSPCGCFVVAHAPAWAQRKAGDQGGDDGQQPPAHPARRGARAEHDGQPDGDGEAAQPGDDEGTAVLAKLFPCERHGLGPRCDRAVRPGHGMDVCVLAFSPRHALATSG